MTYSSTMAMSRQRYTMRNQNAVSYQAKDRRLGPITNTIVLIILACLLGLLYLTQVTKTNAFGYTINGLREEQTKLSAEYADLEIASARLQSIERVQASKPAAELVAVAPSAVIQ